MDDNKIQINLMKSQIDTLTNQIENLKTSFSGLVNSALAEIRSFKTIAKTEIDFSKVIDDLKVRIGEFEKSQRHHLNIIEKSRNINVRLEKKLYYESRKEAGLDARIGVIERYFDSFNFSNIIKELENVDKEYQQKINDVILKLSIKNISTPQKANDDIDFDFLFKRIDDLDFNHIRTVNALVAANFEYIGDLVCNKSCGPTWTKLLLTSNIGQKSFKDIKETLKRHGYEKPALCEEYWERREKKTGKAWNGEII